MKFLSICSGIEAASVATAPLGWKPVAFAEIEPFPCQVLAHHYPHVPNLGDLTQWRTWPAALLVQVEILLGGTPCQAFSLAGLRESLDDDRGNLTLIFCELYAHITTLRRAAGLPPPLCLWENVPGVLSTHDNAFGCFLAGLAGETLPLLPPGPAPKPGRPHKWADAGAVLGPKAAVAWRTLDAQYFRLAQRRRRVFALGSADPAFDPLPVLLEWDSLRRDTPPSRRPGQTTAHPVAPCLTSGGRGIERTRETRGQDPVVAVSAASGRLDFETETFLCVPATEVSPTLLSGGNSTGGHRPPGSTVDNCESLVPCAFKASHYTRGKDGAPSDLAPPLSADADKGDQDTLVMAYRTSGNCGAWETGDKVDALTTGTDRTSHVVAFSGRMRGDDGRGYDRPPQVFGEVVGTLDTVKTHCVAFQPRIARNGRGNTGDLVNALQAQSGQSGQSGKGDAAPCVAVKEAQYFNAYQRTIGGVTGPIMASDAKKVELGVIEPVAYTLHGTREGTREVVTPTDTAGTTREGTGSAIQNSSNTLALDALEPGTANREPGTETQWRVRRLTPEECELLQGFPIGYTLLPHRSGKGKLRKGTDLAQTIAYLRALGMTEEHATACAHSPDGPRYKALGNSWAINVITWITRRIHVAQASRLPSPPPAKPQ